MLAQVLSGSAYASRTGLLSFHPRLSKSSLNQTCNAIVRTVSTLSTMSFQRLFAKTKSLQRKGTDPNEIPKTILSKSLFFSRVISSTSFQSDQNDSKLTLPCCNSSPSL